MPDKKGKGTEKGGRWAPLALLGLVLVFYWRVLFERQAFVFVDASQIFYPIRKW